MNYEDGVILLDRRQLAREKINADSLMGVIAYVRQAMLDAQQHSAALAVYEKTPAGLQRPRHELEHAVAQQRGERGREHRDNEQGRGQEQPHRVRPAT